MKLQVAVIAGLPKGLNYLRLGDGEQHVVAMTQLFLSSDPPRWRVLLGHCAVNESSIALTGDLLDVRVCWLSE